MILLADSEGPDQTAWMRRLIWAFTVRICSKTRFRLMRAIFHTSAEWRAIIRFAVHQESISIYMYQDRVPDKSGFGVNYSDCFAINRPVAH